MQQEIEALEKNGTWSLTTLPPRKKALGCKWVYRIKLKSDGTVKHYRARLAILGNNKVEGEDYIEIFAPAAKLVTVCALLAVVVVKGWEIHQMDVHNAFLYADLAEKVYMKLPPGFHSSYTHQVGHFKKSLYTLQQAPRHLFSKVLVALSK